MTTNPLVIYHANCADGFGAAWVCRKAFPDADFHPATYGSLPPDVTGRNVIIVDFSFSYERLVCMANLARSIVVLDHHKTAQQDLAHLPFAGTTNAEFWRTALDDCLRAGVPHMAALFDMHRSGAGIAWDFFFPGSPRPALITHIEDRDLWQFCHAGTREVQAALFSYPYDFDVWDGLMAMDANLLRADGAAIERKHHKDVDELVRLLQRRMEIAGYNVPVASLPYTMTSDAGHMMALGEDFAACYWDTTDARHFSLRAVDGGADVSAIAEQFGGGGHAKAAGFRVPRDHALARA